MHPNAERLAKILRGEIPDRVPNFEFFFNNPTVAAHFLGREHSGDPHATAEFAERIGWGSVCCASFGLRYGACDDMASDGTSHYSGGSPLTAEILDDLKEPDVEAAIADRYLPYARAAHERGLMVHAYVLHCFHSAATGIGLERMAMMCYDAPDLLHEYMQRVENFNQRVIRLLLSLDEAPDLLFFDADCAFKNASMVSPAMYRELVFEPTDASCAILREANVPILFHSDGKMTDIYPVWIEWGVCGAHGVEAQANDLGEIKRTFGDRLTLFGNFDPVLLARGTPAQIAEATLQMLRTGAPGGRYAAAVNTIVSDFIPLENYLALVDTVEQYGWYAPDGTFAATD